MGLPATREITATTSTPVPSTVMNVVQDCIVGRLHAEQEEEIPAGDFVMLTGNPATFDGTKWVHSSASPWAPYAFPKIPVGDRLTSISFAYNRGTSTVGLSLSVLDATGTIVGSALVSDSDTTSSGNQVKKYTGLNHVMLTGQSLALSFIVLGTDAQVFGAAKFWDKLS